MGIAKCTITFRLHIHSSQLAHYHNPCEPVLAGQSAVQLGIISFDPQPEVVIQSGNKETLQVKGSGS